MLSKSRFASIKIFACHNAETWIKCKYCKIEWGGKKHYVFDLSVSSYFEGQGSYFCCMFFFGCDPHGGRRGLNVVIEPISDSLAPGGKMLQPFQWLYWCGPDRGLGFWPCKQLPHSCCGCDCKQWSADTGGVCDGQLNCSKLTTKVG